MGSDRCFYAFWARPRLGWGEVSDLNHSIPKGAGLTDFRFAVHGPPWEKNSLWLNYNKTGLRARANVGQYLKPEFAKPWLEPFHVSLTGSVRQKIPSHALDISMIDGGYLVTGRVKDVIEQVEPERHQFIPARVINQQTGDELYAEQRLHVLNILNWVAPDQFFDLDVTPFEESGVEKFGEPILRRISHNTGWSQCTIRPEWLEIAHLFITGSYSPRPTFQWLAPNRAFMSKVLHDALVRELPDGIIQSIMVPVSEPNLYWKMVLQRRAEQSSD